VFNQTLYLMHKLIGRLEEVTTTATVIECGRNMNIYVNPWKYKSVTLRVHKCMPLGTHK